MTFRRARLQFNQRNVGFILTQEGPCRKRNRPYLRSLKNGKLPVCLQFPVQFPNMEQFAVSWCGSQTVRGAPDENLLTLMRAGEMSIYSLPLLKSKRRFRSRMVRAFRVGVFAGVPSRVLHWQCALHGSTPPKELLS